MMHEPPTPAPLRTLYPPIDAYDTGFLKVDDLHTLYYEQSGNPQGVPVVFLHGGPGCGSEPKHRQYFDPGHYRIVIFDQRGSGKSTPRAELRQNTTSLLVADMEQLRLHLNIPKWHLAGGSWGSTLSLAYAIAYPGHVLSLTIWGIYLKRMSEQKWFLHGMKAIFPEAWHKFSEYIPADERHDLLSAYYQRLTHPDKTLRIQAAKQWCGYEGACLRLIPQVYDDVASPELDLFLYTMAVMGCHYMMHDRLPSDNHFIENIKKIQHLPVNIIQGRYDVVCPMDNAHDLHRAWPEAKFTIVPDAGHSTSEPGTTDALIKATDENRSINV